MKPAKERISVYIESSHWRSWASLVPLAVILIAGAVVLLLKLNYFAGDFRNNLWGPSYLLLHGYSPYRVESIFPGKNAVWFPQAIGLFFPLGWLDERLASNLWLLGSLVLFWMLVRRFHPQGSTVSPVAVAAMILFSPPLLMQLILGQFDLLVIILFLLATRLAMEERFLLVGALVAVALGKPQLTILVAPGLALASLRRGGKRGLLLFGGAVIGVSAILTLPLWLGYPHWVADFIWAQQRNPNWLQPTLYTMAEVWGGKLWRLLPAALSLGFFGLSLWLWWRYPAEEALPWSLALTTLVSPYIWTWDFVLVVPLILSTVYRQRSRLSGLAWVLGWLSCWGLVAVIYRATRGPEGMASTQWHFWMPWFALFLVLGTHAIESRRSGVRWQPLLKRSDEGGPGLPS